MSSAAACEQEEAIHDPESSRYRLVKLPAGAFSVHSLDFGETFHPVVGPSKEAEALYVRQLSLPERFASCPEEFVIWDVGLGSAGNVLTVLGSIQSIPGRVKVLSFDHTLEPLRFALRHSDALGYLAGYENAVNRLLLDSRIEFANGKNQVDWRFHGGDFPRVISDVSARDFPKPHAILFDAFSPASNPAMWTQPLFAGIFQLLDPARPCALPTYSRSTLLRATLLLAGFFVGRGQGIGEKEETTVAANELTLLGDPLDKRWLERARRSTSAEPMWEAVYRQIPLREATWELLRGHPQFA